MSLFCLIHGSTQNSECWNLLIPELEKLNHQAVKIDLPSDRQNAGGMLYAEIIAKQLETIEESVILVGHSFSGMFLPLVASLRPIQHMVYLASFIPKVETSIAGQLFDESPDLFVPDWAEAWTSAIGAGKCPIDDYELALHFLFHDCTPEVAKWGFSTRQLTNAQAAINEVFPLTNYPSNVSHSYIVCNEDRTINPIWSRRAAHDILGVKAIELASGHCPYLSVPKELASILDAVSKANS
ncbi:alpha/beta hydrolase [Pleurocapsa sp. CCALA 161]|uniref:alpha/beta fold hydrolase n=1 Tax=Pleurocapsa sp. CCALA 161 TaxID=2107688 RepID=UPI000D04D5BE|nr:alpha/beta hydrolase [Pleurocapsa sp. CCALA 161]PSB06843.1 alpha/beta hydrolase [Pleurocapsa sp. CCALA 161]